MNSHEKQTAILLLVSNEEIRYYIAGLCKKNKYYPLITADAEECVKKIKRMRSAIVFVDCEVVNTYGARIYSRINVACPGCNVILLCDQGHRDLVKEAMELGLYACILAPYEEWEVLTMVRNILAKKKPRGRKKPCKDQGP